MHSMSTSTAPTMNKLTTLSIEEDVIKRKNDKVFGVRCTKIQGKKDSSFSFRWETVNDYLSCSSILGGWGQLSPLTIAVTSGIPFEKAEDIIGSYKAENIVHMLDINNRFVREYTHVNSLNILHSLIDIGTEIFKNARPRNDYESRKINEFIRSKARTISSRPL